MHNLQAQLQQAKANLEREKEAARNLTNQVRIFHDEKSDLRTEFDSVSTAMRQQRITFETQLEKTKTEHQGQP